MRALLHGDGIAAEHAELWKHMTNSSSNIAFSDTASNQTEKERLRKQ